MTTVHIRIWHQICLKNLTRKRLEKIEVVIRIWECACLALTREIRGTSKEKIYQELGLESLQIRRWYRKLCLFYKIYKNQSLSYLYNIIPTTNTHYIFRSSDKIPYFKTKHNFFKNSFFLSVIIEWNKVDPSLRRCDNSYGLLVIRSLIAIILSESNI